MKDLIVSFLMILVMFIGLVSALCFFVSIPLAFIFDWGIDMLLASVIGALVSCILGAVAMIIDEA